MCFCTLLLYLYFHPRLNLNVSSLAGGPERSGDDTARLQSHRSEASFRFSRCDSRRPDVLHQYRHSRHEMNSFITIVVKTQCCRIIVGCDINYVHAVSFCSRLINAPWFTSGEFRSFFNQTLPDSNFENRSSSCDFSVVTELHGCAII